MEDVRVTEHLPPLEAGKPPTEASGAQVEPVAIGIWAQWAPGLRWSHEGMIRLLGFLIEGIADVDGYIFRIVVPDEIRDDAEQDLRALRAEIGVDFTLHSPRDYGEKVPYGEALADFANRRVPVTAWISVFPFFMLALGLEAPLTVIFPDAITSVFHYFGELYWGSEGAHHDLVNKVKQVLGKAKHIITFSKHVADDHLQAFYGIPMSRVSVVPHAPPDLGGLLPFIVGRDRSEGSIVHAAEMLRSFSAEHGWDYLRLFPFEDVPYIAVSTADRTTKNLRIVLDAVQRLVRDDRENVKLLMTSRLDHGEKWTPVPGLLAGELLQFDVLSMPDLPRQEHAAFYHCAALAVHASFFEGGHAPFPFYEAVSVGTPCLMALGPHVAELLEEEPELEAFTFDPYDADALQRKIRGVLRDRAGVLQQQLAIYARLSRRTWADVARGYAEAAMQGTSG